MALANVPDARSHSEKGARWLGRRWLACSAAMMLRAAIFDMDGLIVDSEPLWRRTEVEVFGEVGLVLTEAMCESTTGLRIDEVALHWFARAPWKGPTPHELAERVATLDRETTLLLLTSLAREEYFRTGTWDRMFACGKGGWLFERWLELTPRP